MGKGYLQCVVYSAAPVLSAPAQLMSGQTATFSLYACLRNGWAAGVNVQMAPALRLGHPSTFECRLGQ